MMQYDSPPTKHEQMAPAIRLINSTSRYVNVLHAVAERPSTLTRSHVSTAALIEWRKTGIMRRRASPASPLPNAVRSPICWWNSNCRGSAGTEAGARPRSSADLAHPHDAGSRSPVAPSHRRTTEGASCDASGGGHGVHQGSAVWADRDSILMGLRAYDYDAQDMSEAHLRERSLLYAADSRGRDERVVTWGGSASPLLPWPPE